MLLVRESPPAKAVLETLQAEPPLPGVPGVIEPPLDELPSVRTVEMRKAVTSIIAAEAGITALTASALT
jgi:hypothetical protein